MLSFFSREYPFYKWYTIDFLEKEGRQVGKQGGRAVGWGPEKEIEVVGSGKKERERRRRKGGQATSQNTLWPFPL